MVNNEMLNNSGGILITFSQDLFKTEENAQKYSLQ